MKTIVTYSLLLAFAGFFTNKAHAQASDLYIHNTTECYFTIGYYAHDCLPDGCGGPTVCISPGTNIIPPCGGVNLEWMTNDIVPTDSDCQPCDAYGSTVERMITCGVGSNLSPIINTCGCGEVEVSYISDHEILIR